MSVDVKPEYRSDPIASQDAPGENETLEPAGGRFLFFQVMPSWMTSFVIHMLLIILLALIALPRFENVTVSLESGDASADIALTDGLNLDALDYNDDLNKNTETEESSEDALSENLELTTIEDSTYDNSIATLFDTSDQAAVLNQQAVANTGLMASSADELKGRSASEKARQLRDRGGTKASEAAVRLAMEWLKAHQRPDGSWSFDHRDGPGAHRTSPNAGEFRKAPNAATAMALLVFLGAGQTHQEGDFKEVVENGLAFLLRNGVPRDGGLSFFESNGGLYNHGLAAICLAEAFAMTEDQRLARPAQLALKYIEFAQDPVGGGWRYEPRQAGDTSAVGWQIMALKSANMSGLSVSEETIRKAKKFLNFVSSESGAFYGYTEPSRTHRKGTTSVGLLCQMYLGWTRDNPGLVSGVAWLSGLGPEVGTWTPDMKNLSERDKVNFRAGMYYNYYATQVLSQYGGEQWKEWNQTMREFLVATQSTEGNSKGSWFFNDPDEIGYVHGGRLYATTLAAMTLEVYYRYMPIYDDERVSGDEFKLK